MKIWTGRILKTEKPKNKVKHFSFSNFASMRPVFQYWGYLMACSEIHRPKGLECKSVCGKVCCMHFAPQLWIHTLGSKPALNSSQRSRTGKPFAVGSCCPPIKRQWSSSWLGMLGPTSSICDSGCGSDAAFPHCNKNHDWKIEEENSTHRPSLWGQA